MTLSLVTTVGGSDSNSYASLAELNAYLEARQNVSDLAAQTDEQKKALLIQATLDLDTCITFKSTKYDTDMDADGLPDQSLQFPRAYTYSTNGTYIPIEVKQAQIEQVIFLFKESKQQRDPGDGNRLQSFSRGGVSMSFKPDLSRDPDKTFISDRARNLLKTHTNQDRGVSLIR
jgi:hypothetical protein